MLSIELVLALARMYNADRFPYVETLQNIRIAVYPGSIMCVATLQYSGCAFGIAPLMCVAHMWDILDVYVAY